MQILAWPCGYTFVAFVWSSLQGIRGAIEQSTTKHATRLSEIDRWIILYLHDFFFRFVCTMAGFVALYACYFIAADVPAWREIPGGTGAVLAGSFIVGVLGVGGQLHYVLLLGKVPGIGTKD